MKLIKFSHQANQLTTCSTRLSYLQGLLVLLELAKLVDAAEDVEPLDGIPLTYQLVESVGHAAAVCCGGSSELSE